jgi:hypothetical protein
MRSLNMNDGRSGGDCVSALPCMLGITCRSQPSYQHQRLKTRAHKHDNVATWSNSIRTTMRFEWESMHTKKNKRGQSIDSLQLWLLTALTSKRPVDDARTSTDLPRSALRSARAPGEVRRRALKPRTAGAATACGGGLVRV